MGEPGKGEETAAPRDEASTEESGGVSRAVQAASEPGAEPGGEGAADGGPDSPDSSSECGRQSPSLQQEDPFEIPTQDAVQRIVDQVEFYFSDANITKDAFLLKHVKRNKEGYVSLKLISSFKRVKHLAKDWRVVAYALKQSQKLEVNEAGTKLRRKEPLPPFDQTAPSRTVVAVNLSPDKTSVERVALLFKACGEISSVRILRPGNPVPSDVRSFAAKHPEAAGGVSAVVEFVRTESAHDACQREWDAGCRVLQLNTPAVAPDKKKKLRKSSRIYEDFSSEEERLRRCSSPQLDGRRWSRDSSSRYLERRYSTDERRYSTDERRYSTDSEYSSRSRSNSCVSTDSRRYSMEECCCHRRRSSRDSEGYSSARSRSDSGASAESLGLRKDWSWSRDRRLSQGEAALLRFPRGPDGGRGFHQLCHTLVE